MLGRIARLSTSLALASLAALPAAAGDVTSSLRGSTLQLGTTKAPCS
jgi:hypothetical protein